MSKKNKSIKSRVKSEEVTLLEKTKYYKKGEKISVHHSIAKKLREDKKIK